ncbi:hypothetical protein QQ045_017889 [Rhodiola kirilowii]
MGEGDSTAALRCLEPSISFGRFENDLLSWEKWSAFSQNKYLEEVEKCATPGSVAEKKAFFEARNVLIAARKAEMLNKQMEACQESSKENEIQDTCGSEVNQYDEEVIDENVFGSESSSPDFVEHPELEMKTNVFVSQESSEDGVSNDISTNQLTADRVTNKTIFTSETCCAPLIDSDVDFTMFGSKSEIDKDSPDDNASKGALEIDKYDCQNATEEAQEEPILESELGGYETDQAFNMQTCVLGSVQTIGGNQVGDSYVMDLKFDVYIDDAPQYGTQEAILKRELSPTMSDQLMLDLASPCKNSSKSKVESENVKSKDTVDIPALETEKVVLEPECDRKLPHSSKDKSAQTQNQKMIINSQKSSKKTFSMNKQNDVELIKKTQISSDPRSSQMSTPKISKPSSPIVKSSSRSLPVARVKKTASSVAPKSPQFLNTTGSIPQSTTPSLKYAFLSPSKKGHDSVPSRKKSISAGVSRKPTPTSLHMSLNCGSKVSGSVSVSVSASITEPRKSLFMEKMGDKEIVKRAFRAFQNMSIPLISVSHDMNATPKQMVKNKTDGKPRTPILQKEKERLVKKGVNEKSKKASSIFKTYNLALHSKEDVRKEVEKLSEKTEFKEAKKNHIQPKHKEGMETHAGVRRQSLTYKATSQPGFHKGQRLSKSFQDKDASKSDPRQ